MIDTKAAEQIIKDNHPVLAGYILDGEVSELDLLASIFKLIEDRVIEPIFDDNDIRRKITTLRLKTSNVSSKYDQMIIKLFFEDKTEISAISAGRKMLSQDFKIAIRFGLEEILGIFVKDKTYQYKLGNTYMDMSTKRGVIKDEKSYRDLIFGDKMGLLMVSIFVIIFILGYNVPVTSEKRTTNLIIYALVCLFTLYRLKTKHIVKLDFSDPKKAEEIKAKYKELFEFLTERPLPPHTFTNEFLPFSIAFGIDQSWNEDFGMSTFHRVYFKQ